MNAQLIQRSPLAEEVTPSINQGCAAGEGLMTGPNPLQGARADEPFLRIGKENLAVNLGGGAGGQLFCINDSLWLTGQAIPSGTFLMQRRIRYSLEAMWTKRFETSPLVEGWQATDKLSARDLSIDGGVLRITLINQRLKEEARFSIEMPL